MVDSTSGWVKVGRISGLFGVRGWVKVFSYTSPRKNILNYSPWQLGVGVDAKTVDLAEGHMHGKGVVARLDGYDDRNHARELIGADILVQRSQFPPSTEGEYYWMDLVGMRVVSLDGNELGKVDSLFETGSNDVLVVKGERERLIPFIRDEVVVDIDLSKGIIQVDWDPEF